MSDEFGRRIARILMVSVCAVGFGFQGACSDADAEREVQFLSRKVKELEDEVKRLEMEVRRLRSSGAAALPSSAAPAPGGTDSPAAGEPVLATPAVTPSASGGLDSMDESQVNLLLLKAKQLQLAPRSELPGLIKQLGISAPELADYERQIEALSAEKVRLLGEAGTDSAEIASLEEQIDKLQFRFELAAEGVRNRVVDEGKKLGSAVEEIRREADGSDSTSAGAPRIR